LGGIKLNEMRDNDLDSDNEERQQLAQDRMRLKKNISAGGNYQLTKVSQPNQSGTSNGAPAQAVASLGDTLKDDGKVRSSSLGALKPSLTSTLSKLKKNNITSSNPIIGAPLGPKKDLSTSKIFPTI